MLEFDRLTTALAFSLVHVLTVVYLNTMNIRRSKLIYSKLFIVSFVIIFPARIFIQKLYIYFPVMLFLLPLCIFYIYRLNIAEAFALSMISDIIILFGELIAQSALNRTPESIFPTQDNFEQTSVKNLSFLCIAAVVIVTSSLIRKKALNKRIIKNIIYYILLLALVNVALNVLLLVSGAAFEKIYLTNFCYKVCVFILLLFILSLSSKARFEHRSQKYMQLNKYTQIIEDMYEDLVSQQHDFSNILLSINGYIDDNRINELREYINKYVMKDLCKNMNNSFVSSLKYVQNPALKGIIFSKLNQAATKNIKLFINIFTEIDIYNIDPADLVRIVGILFDNAIEACEKSPQNELHLGMESDKTHTSILIGNTYFQLPDIKLICKRGYSTKGKNRGFGLYNLKKILSLYPHAHLKTTVSDNMFFQELIILK
ncbi:MAG: GHKL domain-containing protein [Clostridiaceae bacterium]|nr:GHKL domain-containing protein [Clostridiaceae bacterium]